MSKVLTQEYFLYNFTNYEGTACSIVRTERELTKEELLPFRKAVMEVYRWVEEAFSIYRYTDEDRLNYLIRLWSEDRPRFPAIDINGNILKPFGESNNTFEGMHWRNVYGYASI